MFFQEFHSFNEEEFTISMGQNFVFPSHIHRAFELYMQVQGTAEVVIDKRTYILKEGQAVLIFPFQQHAYKAIENSVHKICIFSPGLVSHYYRKENFIPTDNLFAFTLDHEKPDHPLLCRAIAYEICGQFDKGRKYIERKELVSRDHVALILLYANENYMKKCLLCDAASSVGVDYAYISKLFKKTLGVTYNQYVNYMRIHESTRLLKSTKKTITEIAFACGFSSLRAFNRKFFDIEKTTPSNYRNREKMGENV